MAKPVGPFSPWRRIGQMIATSGQIGLDDDGKVVGGGFGPELEQTLRNLSNVLADAGVAREQVIKVNVYLADLADWSALNGPYAEFYTRDGQRFNTHPNRESPFSPRDVSI